MGIMQESAIVCIIDRLYSQRLLVMNYELISERNLRWIGELITYRPK